jgi:tetratricopeptide (TPR) repeat protein
LSERVTALVLGELGADESARVLEHVETCAECSRQLDFLAEVTTVAARAVPSVRARRASLGWRRWIAAAAAVLLVAFIAWRAFDRADDWRELADRSVPVFVAAQLRAPPPSLATELEEAMHGWEQRDFTRVDAALTRFVAAHAEHAPAYFWRGVARRELGRLDEAESDLRTAAAKSQGYLREHSLWVVANLRLARGELDGTRAALRELEQLEGEFAAKAFELDERLRSAR